jgi:hypothetical protein
VHFVNLIPCSVIQSSSSSDYVKSCHIVFAKAAIVFVKGAAPDRTHRQAGRFDTRFLWFGRLTNRLPKGSDRVCRSMVEPAAEPVEVAAPTELSVKLVASTSSATGCAEAHRHGIWRIFLLL